MSIRTSSHKARMQDAPRRRAGIYFLIDGAKITYIGESGDVDGRIATHARSKAFSRVLVMELPDDMTEWARKEIETMFIRSLRTPENSDFIAAQADAAEAKTVTRRLEALERVVTATGTARGRIADAPSGKTPSPLAYRVDEACRVAGVGKTTLWKAVKEGALQRRKVGSRTLIPAESLRAWLDVCETPGRPAR